MEIEINLKVKADNLTKEEITRLIYIVITTGTNKLDITWINSFMPNFDGNFIVAYPNPHFVEK